MEASGSPRDSLEIAALCLEGSSSSSLVTVNSSFPKFLNFGAVTRISPF